MARETMQQKLDALRMQCQREFEYGIQEGRKRAAEDEKSQAFAARTALVKVVAEVAQANAKLTYAVSQIIAEKKGFGA